jgi:hypothetical protein
MTKKFFANMSLLHDEEVFCYFVQNTSEPFGSLIAFQSAVTIVILKGAKRDSTGIDARLSTTDARLSTIDARLSTTTASSSTVYRFQRLQFYRSI